MNEMTPHIPEVNRIRYPSRHKRNKTNNSRPLELSRRRCDQSDKVFCQVEEVLEGDLEGGQPVLSGVIVQRELKLFELKVG